MSGALDRGRQAFLTEAAELLEELEASLLALEETPGDTGLIGRIFRAMHTLKGSGGMFGFDSIETFTHHIESFFDRVRNGDITVTHHMVDLTLASCDVIRTMLDTESGGAGGSAASRRAAWQLLREYEKSRPSVRK